MTRHRSSQIVAVIACILLFAVSANAREDLQDPARTMVIAAADRIERNYVVTGGAQGATAIADRLRDSARMGDYDGLGGAELAAAVTNDLTVWSGGDAHLFMLHDEGAFANGAMDPSAVMRDLARIMPLQGDGVVDVRRLPGNVGYLRLDSLLPSPRSAEALANAFGLVDATYSLILDLRACSGGESSVVARAASHLLGLAPGSVVGRVDIRWEGDMPHDMGDIARGMEETEVVDVETPYGADRPVLVLVGPQTFSGCEELAYTLRAFGRAETVGAPTRGGARPGSLTALGPDHALFVPWGSFVHPVTGDNWEETGVEVDHAVEADGVFRAAYDLMLLRTADQRVVDQELAAEALEAANYPNISVE